MRLPVFASEFERQCLEPSDQEDSFEVRLKRGWSIWNMIPERTTRSKRILKWQNFMIPMPI